MRLLKEIKISLLVFILAVIIAGFFLTQSLAGGQHNVSGWAWSSNIGWISFNCTNLISCLVSDYGVNIDPDTGLISGYAWSENIGWVSFNEADLVGCPSGVCKAIISGGLTGTFPKAVSGWAKVLSTNGWIHLADSSYGAQVESNGDFSGWAWGGESIGWIHWVGPTYKVSVQLPAALSPPSPPPPGQGGDGDSGLFNLKRWREILPF